MEGGQERAQTGEQSHVDVHVVRQGMDERDLVQLLLLQDQRDELDDQDGAVAGECRR